MLTGSISFTVVSERGGGEAGVFRNSGKHGAVLDDGNEAVAPRSGDSHLRLDRGCLHTHLPWRVLGRLLLGSVQDHHLLLLHLCRGTDNLLIITEITLKHNHF